MLTCDGEVFGGELAAIAAEELMVEMGGAAPGAPPWGPRPDLAATARRPSPAVLAAGVVGVAVVGAAVVRTARRR